MRLSVSKADLAQSVLAVPPLAVDAAGDYAPAPNATLIRHIQTGGVSTLLYGGNALAQHWPMSRYAAWLDQLIDAAADQTWIIPSVGADGGRLVDQAPILRERGFPVAMLLPMSSPLTADGMLTAVRRFHRDSGAQLLIYVKTDGYIDAEMLAALDRSGTLFGVKYAVPRQDPAQDDYLRSLIAAIGADRIVSGFGEPPAVNHMLRFGLAGFTAGCVCIAPSLSMAALKALKASDRAKAEAVIAALRPLEALRGEINEIRVLHDAVAMAGIAETGPILPPSSPVPQADRARVASAAKTLLAAETAFRARRAA
ncbi:MAG: dihydrodipicolinate synthase family protein [Rubrimonas sp.]